ncbi:MAG: ABC transporter permease, partial [Bdellovibrionota bacterium]
MKRVLALALNLLLIFFLSRALVRMLPGDPIETIVAESATSVDVDALRVELGLDQPWYAAAWTDLGNALRGDFGRSIQSRDAIAPMLAQRFWRTAELVVLVVLFGLGVSTALGMAAAHRPGGRWDRFCTVYAALAASLPLPWLGPMLAVAFAVLIPIFKISGGLGLPVLALVIGFSGLWARLIRFRVREAVRSDAYRAAQARGVRGIQLQLKYGLAPVSGFLVAYLGTQLGSLLGGAVVSETLFDWPGMGLLFFEAVLKRDYPVVEATAFVAAALSLGGTAA